MKKYLIAAAFVFAAAVAAAAQTTVKTASSAAGLGKPVAGSSEEMNIRAYIELLRTDLKNSKTQIMGAVLDLDAADAARFWPIYKDFEAEYAKLGDQILALVKNYVEHYREMTEAVADAIGSQVLDIEQQRNALKKRYFERVKGALGAITATRFLQVENQLERIVDLQIAAQLPIPSSER